MIENLDEYYAQIANYMVEAIPEEWTEALYEATFFPGSSTYEGEYISKSEQRARSYNPDSSVDRLFREIRKLFKEAENHFGEKLFLI